MAGPAFSDNFHAENLAPKGCSVSIQPLKQTPGDEPSARLQTRVALLSVDFPQGRKAR